MHCIPLAFPQCFIHLDVCLFVENHVLLGLDWVEPMMQFSFSASHVHAYFRHTYPFFSIFLFWVLIVFPVSFSWIDCVWHPGTNLLQSETLFFPSHHLLLILPFPLFTFDSVMRRPIRISRRTFLNMAFIQSAMWFYWTFSILLFSMSFTLRDGNLFVRYPWGVPLCSYRSFTPTCTESIPLCLDLSRHSEVHLS